MTVEWSKPLEMALRVGAIALSALLALGAIGALERSLLRRLESLPRINERRARLRTLIGAGNQTLRAVVIALALISALSALGVNVAPLLASLGLVGLALSLGAQTLIRDYVAGLMILIEDQYTVGETVTIQGVSGSVERLTLRLTVLRDFSGRLHFIPNGEVRLVTNASRDWALAWVDLNLPLDANLAQALPILQEAAQRLEHDEHLGADLLDTPQVQGWQALSDWAVQVRISARTRPERRPAVEQALRQTALEALRGAGISLALPPRG